MIIVFTYDLFGEPYAGRPNKASVLRQILLYFTIRAFSSETTRAKIWCDDSDDSKIIREVLVAID